MLTFVSLFAGIGGIDLGLERAGMECVAQVEIDDYAQRVLTKHWPSVPKFRDVRTVGAVNLPRADVIAGGFPCQDISNAGKRAGIDGERSGLWSEYARIVRELRPRYVLMENVSALLGRGLGRVLGDLASCGYDAEWQCIPASAIGAPHRRDRIFIVAYPAGDAMEKSVLVQVPRRSSFKPRRVHRFADAGVDWQDNQPAMVGMVDGVSNWMDRSKGLGNAVVPQVAEYIGRLIVQHAESVEQ